MLWIFFVLVLMLVAASVLCQRDRITSKQFQYRRSAVVDVTFIDLGSSSMSALLALNPCLHEAYKVTIRHTLELLELGSDE